MVVKTNTVTYPWTVVVHTQNASVAYAAMMSPWWSMFIAFCAEIHFGWYVVSLVYFLIADEGLSVLDPI